MPTVVKLGDFVLPAVSCICDSSSCDPPGFIFCLHPPTGNWQLDALADSPRRYVDDVLKLSSETMYNI